MAAHLFSTSRVLPGANTRIRESRDSIQCTHHHLPLFLSGSSKEICFNYRCYFCPGLCHTCISSHRCLCIWWFPQALPLQGEVLFLLFPSSCPEGISVSLDRGSGGGTMQLFFSPSLFFLTALLRRQPKSQSGLSFGPEESGKEAGKCGGDAREKRALLLGIYT